MSTHESVAALRAALFATVLAAMAQAPASAAAQAERIVAEAVVEAVQMPAWVERGASKVPLAPGMELYSQDRVHTGSDARILLRTSEGSSVKLGERGSLLLENVRIRRRKHVRSDHERLRGMFRFTTNTLVRFRGRRYVQVTISA